MKISACWIAKNEAANIGRSLESVKDITDELIVVDTGSSDDTAAIAGSLGARVEYFEWIGDFSAARNYAMSLAAGDVIIFLDADEWFEPKLGPSDRLKLEEIFSKNRKVEMLTLKINNLDSNGTVLNSTIVSRIYRNKETLRYHGSIHEYISTPAAGANILVDDGLSINHSGYNSSVVASKIERNTAMLEAALENAEAGSDERDRFLLYLVREAYQTKQYEKASGYLKELLKSEGALERLCRSHTEEIMSSIYAAIWTASTRRIDFSRRDVRRKLFDLFKRVHPNYPGTAEIDVLYQALFDMKEDRFLKELEPAIDAASKRPSSVSHYKDREQLLYAKGAMAAWRRGDRMKSLEYSVSALKGSHDYRQEQLLHILLNAVKGQPPEDIIYFLNGIFNVSNPDELDYLIRETRVDGFPVVHAYYLKKRIDTGDAYIRDHLRFMLIHRQYEALASLVVEGHAAGDVDAPLYLLLAAVCGAPAELVQAHANIIGDYLHVLNAFYNGERLPGITPADLNLIQETYSTVALVAGLEIADRYLNVFRARPDLCFLTKAVYCEISHLNSQLLLEDMSVIGWLDFACRQYIIQAMIAAKRYEEALRGIEAFLKEDYIEPALLNMLLVVAEQAAGEAGVRARWLYDRYIDLYDAMVDLDDVVQTGIVYDDGGKKQNQFFRYMSRDQFEKYLTEESARPITKRLLELYRQAADVYRQNNLPAEAARCLWRIIAHGEAEQQVRENLAEAFAELKNTVLAGYVRERAG